MREGPLRRAIEETFRAHDGLQMVLTLFPQKLLILHQRLQDSACTEAIKLLMPGTTRFARSTRPLCGYT